MYPMSLLFLVLLVPLAANAGEPKPDDLVNNPMFAYWSSFNPGTAVTQGETVTLSDGTRLKMVTTYKLLEKTRDKVVIEGTLTQSNPAHGAVSSQKTVTLATFPAKVKKREVDTPESEMESLTEGKEQIEVKGRKVEADWVEAVIKSGDEVVTEKVWIVKEIPGGLIKQTLVKKKGEKVISESVLELVEFKLADRKPKKK